MAHNFRKRVQQVIGALKHTGGSNALVLSSNPPVTRSADQRYPYRANSDLYYLTGSTAPDLTLVIRNKATPQVVLIVAAPDPTKILWEGSSPTLAPVAKAIGATVIKSKEPQKSLRDLLRGIHCVYTQSVPNTHSNALRQQFAQQRGEPARHDPLSYADAGTIVSALRLIKSRSEINAIAEAGAVTAEVLHAVLPLVTPGTKEREIATLIECLYRTNGGESAFSPIVATGASAATLHYHAHNRTLRQGDLLLIDTGVELGMYASDITRTIPVGKISEAQATLYEAVLAAQRAAFQRVKHNALIRDVYRAAAHEITLGLKETGVLKGSVTTLMKKEAFKPYFPHGIGHSLGIDVHDVGGLRGNQEARLQTAMVFTIEPGVYLSKPTKHLPALGIRIEDDIVVERDGCTVLTDNAFPKELHEIAELIEESAAALM